MSTESQSRKPDGGKSAEVKSQVDRKSIGKASFSVNARVAMQLGRESISSSVTALIELVKNAYDADAKRVRIRFAGLEGNFPRMVVEDDGNGMSLRELQESWMVIGTSAKARARKPTAKGRIMTGEKGLGRLGLDRLCERTRVQSKKKGMSESFELVVEWSRYENSEDRLETIEHDIYSLPHLNFDSLTGEVRRYPHGTRLVLESLKDRWDEQTLRTLRKELSLMVSPFAKPRDFVIEIQSGMDWKSVDGPVVVPKFVLDAATWKVVARIDAAGYVTIDMTSAQHHTTYRLKKTKWADFAKGIDELPACGPTRFVFYYFPRVAVSLPEQTLGIRDLNLFLDSNQGVRIYRDGFRVKPYGDPDGQGDWLTLSFRKIKSPAAVSRAGDWRVAYNQAIGAVFISREKNATLLDQTNREGLVEGPGFRDLRVFATKVVDYFELNHSEDYAGKQAETSKAEAAKDRANQKALESLAALDRLSSLVKRLPTPSTPAAAAPIAEIRNALEDARRSVSSGHEAAKESERAAEEELEKTKGEKNTMANLASLGILSAAFGHETLGLTDSAAKNALWLQTRITEDAILLPHRQKEEAQRVLDELAEDTGKIEMFAKFTLDTVSPDKRRRRKFSLKALIVEVFQAFKASLEEQRNIEVDLQLPGNDDCLIRAYPADWESILVNLITNAVWAMEKKPKGRRTIRVTMKLEGGECVLVFEDSGRGLEAGTEKQIFQPTYSSKRDERGEVYGTGMGLTIVKSCVEENSGGTVMARVSGELGGAVFEIRVPRVSSG
jgi:signal transduction histidine kinase